MGPRGAANLWILPGGLTLDQEAEILKRNSGKLVKLLRDLLPESFRVEITKSNDPSRRIVIKLHAPTTFRPWIWSLLTDSRLRLRLSAGRRPRVRRRGELELWAVARSDQPALRRAEYGRFLQSREEGSAGD